MRLIFLFFSIFVIITISQCVLGKVFPKNELTIAQNNGFFSYLMHPFGFGKLLNCSVTLPRGQKLNLDPIRENPEIHKIDGALIQRYSQSVCGVKVLSLNKNLGGTWILEGSDDRRSTDKDDLKITVLERSDDPSPKIITVPANNPKVRFDCPNNYQARHCRIWTPEGKLLEDVCEVSTTIIDNSTWRCGAMHWGQMKEIISEVSVFIEENPEDEKAVITEDQEKIVLTCNDKVGICRAEKPNGEQLYINEGLLAERYSAYDTQSGRCSLEIRKPLQASDLGVWRMYLDDKSRQGCVFQVGPKVVSSGSNVKDPIKIDVFQPPGNTKATFEITCKAPHEIEYCYIQRPETSDVKWEDQDPDYFLTTKSLGICTFTVKQLVSGLYACGVNDINGGEDIQTYYDVNIFTVPAKPEEKYLSANHGQSTRMLVKTLFNHSISYCRFVTPNGEVHGVSNKFNMTGNLRYYGAGLNEGECGLSIQKINEHHFGVWKSIFKVDNHEYTIQFVLSESTLDKAYMAIIIIVLTSLLITGGAGLAFFAFKKGWLRRRRRYVQSVGTEMDYSEASHDS